MGEFNEAQHPRGHGGKFTAGGGAEHVGDQGRKARSLTDKANKATAGAGDEKSAHQAAAAAHGKARDAHLKAASKTADPIAKSGHQAAAANHASQVTAHETKAATAEAKSPTQAFVDKHAPKDEKKPEDKPKNDEKKPSEKPEKKPKEHGEKHEGGHEHEEGGLGEWVKSKAEALREGVKEAGEKANRIEESAMRDDPAMLGMKAAGGAIATAKAAVEKTPLPHHHEGHGHE